VKYHQEGAADLAAFTYFKDQAGFIFYSSGDNSLDNDAIRSVLVYSPTDNSSAARFQPSSETPYAKCLSHGYRSELPRLRDSLPPTQFGIVAAMFVCDSDTDDEFLAVPSERITEVYDPNNALLELVEGSNPVYSTDASDRVREAVGAFGHRGIHLGRLGLYGGLQCSLVHTDGKEINDIDLLVDGLGAYGDMVALATGNVVRPETFPSFITSHAIKRAVAMRRGQLSQFRLSQHPDTVVDARLVRTPLDDRETAVLLSTLNPGNAVTLTGATVIDASESLSVPARFKVQDTDGKAWSVVTNQYHHLGAATNGDAVSVHGRMAGDSVLMLTDPDRHHIHIPDLS
jgi:predicted nucleotidyltransferase